MLFLELADFLMAKEQPPKTSPVREMTGTARYERTGRWPSGIPFAGSVLAVSRVGEDVF